jgi:formylglycine-generating enzyme required for sulfatase activity
VIYDEACDFAMRGEFTTAEKLFRKLINRNDPTFGAFSHEWVNLLREYVRIHDMAQRRNTRKIAQGQWLNYTQQFPKAFVDDIFDPKNVTQLFVAESTSPVIPVSPPPAAVQPKPAPVSPPPPAPKPAKPRSANVLPAPFAWVDIPAGKVSLVNTWDDDSKVYLKKDKPQTFDVAAFKLAKYPLTNAQFKLFVDAGGYREKRWWTAAGWEAKLKGWAWKGSEYMETNQPWTEPRYWQDAKWNTPDQPVVGVSWYESVAFCQWLSEQTGEKIMLPTEQQWQFAAQGQEGRVYPWGKDWDGTRCNNSVKPQDSNVTTPVRQFEGKGDSPFGIVDMAGNVWEWCLTDYEQGTQDINSNATYRVLRGGSWINYSSDYFRCVFRLRNDPHNGGDDRGLRLALS